MSGPELEELAGKTVRVDGEERHSSPRWYAAYTWNDGLTVQLEAEAELNKRLSTYIRHPQVALDVKDLRSQLRVGTRRYGERSEACVVK